MVSEVKPPGGFHKTPGDVSAKHFWVVLRHIFRGLFWDRRTCYCFPVLSQSQSLSCIEKSFNTAPSWWPKDSHVKGVGNFYQEYRVFSLSLSLCAISNDVGDHGFPQFSISSFLKQCHLLVFNSSFSNPLV